MRYFLTFFVLPLSVSAKTIRRPAQVDSKSKLAVVFQSYLSCRTEGRSNLEVTRACINPIVDPNTRQYRRDRLATWLLMNIDVSVIRDCQPEEVAERKFFPERTKHALCFEMNIEGLKKTGIVYFKSLSGKSYVHSFDY